MKISDIKPHPILEFYEKQNKDVVFLEGIIGSKAGNTIRLYPDLESRSFYEIPEAAILHVEKCCKDCGEDGRIKAYVPADLEIRFVLPANAGTFHIQHNWPFQSLADTRIDPWPQIVPLDVIIKSPCVQNCIRMINETTGYTKVIDGGGVFLVQVTPAGLAALKECLRRCGYLNKAVLERVIDLIENSVAPPQP